MSSGTLNTEKKSMLKETNKALGKDLLSNQIKDFKHQRTHFVDIYRPLTHSLPLKVSRFTPSELHT